MIRKSIEREQYESLLKSGFFWEFHPDLSGEWENDKEKWTVFCEKHYPSFYRTESKSSLTPDELIDTLKEECRRVKVQRNNYEQELIKMTKRAVKAESELQLLERYINRNKS
jgi:hypothetical protein